MAGFLFFAKIFQVRQIKIISLLAITASQASISFHTIDFPPNGIALQI